MIGVHYWPTNGLKVTIMIEECGLPYKVFPANIEGRPGRPYPPALNSVLSRESQVAANISLPWPSDRALPGGVN